MKKIILMITCWLGASCALAQGTPKWANKAKKAVFSIVTYDAKNQIKATGNGFYINEDGTALTDFTLFDGADHAVTINTQGKEAPVDRICGVNAIYDVLKIRTEADKKIEALPVAKAPAKVGETVYLLPYATQKSSTLQTGKVTRVDSIGEGSFYYTLSMKAGEKNVSCPVMNAQGEVLALIQKNSSADSKESYAIGANFSASLDISAFAANDANLNKIGIRKALPSKEDQALVYLIMYSEKDLKEYTLLVDEYLTAFPQSPDGYIRKAALLMESDSKAAEELIEKGLKVSTNKAESHYNIAKLIYHHAIAKAEKKEETNWNLDCALENINHAIADKEEPMFLSLKGDILFGMKRYAEALECYTKFNKTELASPTSFYSAAKAKQGIEGTPLNEVIALLDSTIAHCPLPYTTESSVYFFERAELKMENKQYREAVIDYCLFQRAYKGEVSANFYYKREQAEMQCKMFQQAIMDINLAVNMEPKNVDFWLEKASVHMRVGQFAEAEKATLKACELDSKNAVCFRMLGYSQVMMKKQKEGLGNLKKALSMGDEISKDLIKKYK